ncbi:Nramp family divalent metal transporter [Bacteroidota bacterium]
MTKRKTFYNRLAIGLAAVGPGLFLIGYNIGTGSVTTMARAGARYGMSLFWALVLSCIFTYILMVAYGQMTLVSGNTALNNFKNYFRIGKPLSIYIIIALITGELLAIMGVMGIVVDLLQEGIQMASGHEVGGFSITLVLVVVLYAMLWFGHYKGFEKVLTVFVIGMALCFIIVFFMVKPDITVIAKGMVPRIPKQTGAFQLIAAMAGTTCSAAVFIVRSTVVAEKGWTINDLKTEKKDAFVSAGMMLLLSGVIMAVAAGTLFVMGLDLTNTVEMIALFEPLGGTSAAYILILGIAGAGLSTVFPIILIAPWLICDYAGIKRDIKTPLFRILGGIGILFSFGLVFIDERPPAMMIFSQAFQALILPAVAIPIFILINNEKLMGKYKAGKWMNIGLMAVIIFSLITSYFAIIDLL